MSDSDPATPNPSPVISISRERWIVVAMAAVYVLLALAFSLGPIFEGPDEIEHYRFIRALALTHNLPDPRTQQRAQYHQAPLYYVLNTALFAPFDLFNSGQDDFARIDNPSRINPFYPYQLGVPGSDNKNLYLHTRAESFPYSGSSTARAVHLMRLVSVLLGLCTVLTAYAVFRLLWPDRPDRRLMALALVAFMPQFLYLSGTLNNDNLIFWLATLTLYLLLRMRLAGRSGLTVRNALLLGLVLGAALLTKVNAAFMAFPVALVLFVTPGTTRLALFRRDTWRFALQTLATLAVLAGWWYVRNMALYGDPTAINVLLETWKTETIRSGSVALDIGLGRVPYAYQTTWARFGQGAVPVAQPIYDFFDALLIVAGAGLLIGVISEMRRNKNTSGPFLLALLLMFAGVWLASLVYYASTAWSGNQGRYLLPGIAAWAALITFGLDTWTLRRLRLPAALSGVVILAAVAGVAVFGYFLPSYQPASDRMPPERALSLHYGDVAELTGMSPAAPHGHPGDLIYITLYWRGLKPAPVSLYSYLHSAEVEVIKRDSLPGTGNLLAPDWQPGQTWAERYVVRLPADAPTQSAFPLLAGLYDPTQHQDLPVTHDGAAITPVIGRIAINGQSVKTEGDDVPPPAYRLGDNIGLDEPRIQRTGETVEICLRWQALAPVPADYNVFIHLLVGSIGSAPMAQADFQPKASKYPTSAWLPGEKIEDCQRLSTTALNRAPTNWWVAVGLYDVASQQRLPVYDTNKNPLPDDRVLVAGNGY